MTKNSKYVQFSKKMVIVITSAVTAMTVFSILLCYFLGEETGIVKIISGYLTYATVCFVAYSGNSACEKWLIRKYGINEEGDLG